MMTNSSPADFQAVDAHLRALLLEFLADEFVRSRNSHGPLHAGCRFERFEARGHVAADADDADHNSLLAFDRVDLEAKFPNPLAYVVDLRLGSVRPH